ncbi:M15 family metallopeptidase [Candidatus Saccharibacteria bacterium]|nr:M15 family metallopeptidase [Candidatus Saccharibacteria bacterium]MCL1962746.1 M15 family metallopeptidase [Candidatus Saccharibacteria bacterium]
MSKKYYILGVVAVPAVILCCVFFGGDMITSDELDREILNSPTQNETPEKPATEILMLVNATHKIPDDFTPTLTTEGVIYNVIMSDDVEEMRQAAMEEGIYLVFNDAYRNQEQQQWLYDTLGSRLAQKPGYSEHETGLAIDFSFNQLSSYDQTQMWNWLKNNSYKYGFILRYPAGKESITGIDYEAWHYRYVGKDAAKIIYENDWVLEEYLEKNQAAYAPDSFGSSG